MASFQLTSDRFPAGTSVGAYPRAGWSVATLPPSGPPPVAATETRTTNANLTATFSALADQTRYFAGASVSGTWRYVEFQTPVAPPPAMQPLSDKNQANGYAGLGADTKVATGQIPDLSGTLQARTEKGAASGYASLGADGKVPAAQIPAEAVVAQVTRTTNQTGIVTATPTALAFTSEIDDPSGMHDNTTNPSRITVPVAGYYAVSCSVRWSATTGSYRHMAVRVSNVNEAYANLPAGVISNISTIVRCAAGDYIEVFVEQDSGGPLAVVADTYSPDCSVVRVG